MFACCREDAEDGGRMTNVPHCTTMVRCGDAVQVLVGRNNRQNDELSHRVANPDDLWMHVRGVPGRWGVHMRIHNLSVIHHV